jgi:hypothetical protein
MFDVNEFLARCPEVGEMRNGTEFVITLVTQGLAQLERGSKPVDEERLEEALADSVSEGVDRTIREMRDIIAPVASAVLTKASSAKGKVGEQMFETWVKDINTWDCEKVALTGHSGDFIHTHYDTGVRVLSDAKNYAKKVPKAEQEKLWSDMQTMGIQLGLLVSMSSGIASKRDGVDVEIRSVAGRNHVLVFLSNATVNKEWVFVCLEILRLHQSCPSDSFDLDAYLLPLREILDLAKSTEADAEKMEKDIAKRLAEHRKSVQTHQQRIQRIIQNCLESHGAKRPPPAETA